MKCNIMYCVGGGLAAHVTVWVIVVVVIVIISFL